MPTKPKNTADERTEANQEIEKHHGDTPGSATTRPDPLEKEQEGDVLDSSNEADPAETPEEKADNTLNSGRIWS